MRRAAGAMGALALLASCTHVGTYHPKHFAPWQIAPEKKLEGRALVLTTAGDDVYVWSGRPTSIFGSGITLRLPLGVVTREAARRVFGDLFIGGVEASNDASRREGYRAVVSPRVTAFEHEYGWFTGYFVLSIHVALLDAGGAVSFEKTYRSGRLEVAARPPEVETPEAISQGVHVAAQAIMLQAAGDVREHLAAPAAPAPRPPGTSPAGGIKAP